MRRKPTGSVKPRDRSLKTMRGVYRPVHFAADHNYFTKILKAQKKGGDPSQ